MEGFGRNFEQEDRRESFAKALEQAGSKVKALEERLDGKITKGSSATLLREAQRALEAAEAAGADVRELWQQYRALAHRLADHIENISERGPEHHFEHPPRQAATKEYVMRISVGENRLRKITEDVQEKFEKEKREKMSAMEARHEVLQAIVYGIQAHAHVVKRAVFTIFTSHASIVVTEVMEEDVEGLEKFIESLDPVVKSVKTLSGKKFEKKIEKGKLPDWWMDALFNRNKARPSEVARWIYEKFFSEKKDTGR